MTPNRTLHLPGLAAATLALMGVAALQADPLPATLGEVIDVRVVNVEVVVTDENGVRVTGLEPSDLTLTVDGEPVAIEYFSEIRGGRAVAGSSGGLGTPAVGANGAPGTSYLLFLDEAFSLETDRSRVLAGLVRDLSFLEPEDRMAIVAWDGRRLEMLATWTDSRRALAEALETAGERPARGLERRVEQRSFGLAANPRGRAAFASSFDRLSLDERFYAELLSAQLTRGVRAAAATLRGFGAPPGRRVMLLASGGWPFSPVQFVAGNGRPFPVLESGLPEGEEIYGPLVETANTLGYTIYPVDVAGLQTTSGVDLGASTSGGAGLAGNLDFFRETEIHRTFQWLARETGGKALLNAGRERALGAVAEDTRSFYWLGFTPSWAGDDGQHEIRVEALRPGLTLRARSGFADLSRQSQVAMAVESAVIFGNPSFDEPLLLEMGLPERSGWGKVEVPITIRIPARSLALAPVPEGFRARVDLYLAVLDSAGDTADVPVIPLELTRAALPAEGDEVVYETRLTMRREPHDLVATVYDPATGAMVSGSARLVL